MNNYELLVIISSKLTEEEIPFITDKLFELIKKNEGNIVRDNNLGKKKLSYPIQHQRYGFYVQVDFDLPGNNLRKIEKELKLMNELIRYIVVTRDVLAEARAEKRVKEEKERKVTAPVIEEKPVAAPKPPKSPAKPIFGPAKPEVKESFASSDTKEEKEKEKKPARIKEKKVSLEELDEKLDQILDDDIMRT